MKKRILVLLVLLMLLISFCSKPEPTLKLEVGTPEYDLAIQLSEKLSYLKPGTDSVLISTDKYNLTSDEFINKVYSTFGTNCTQLATFNAPKLEKFVKEFGEKMVIDKLLLLKAEKEKITVTEVEVDSIMDLQITQLGGKEKYEEQLKSNGILLENVKQEITAGMTVNKYLEKVFDSKIEIPEEDINKSYNEVKKVKASHILLKTDGLNSDEKKVEYEKLMNIREKILAGEDFAKAATEFSDCPSGKNGGDLGEFTRGQMVKPFEEVAFSLPVDEISDIVETQFGYHIIKVTQRNQETRPLEEVREKIENELKMSKKNDVYLELITEIKEDAGFEIKI